MNFRILLITDSVLAVEGGAVDRALAALPPATAAVQLRDLSAPRRLLFERAERLRAMTASRNAQLLINDGADVARALDVGVHLRRDSCGVAEARGLGVATIGVSTHTVDEVREAAQDGADYVVFGPVFDTPGKGPALGLDALRAAASVGMRVYALGGVTAHNARECLRRGATGIACIRSVLHEADPAVAARRMWEALAA